MERLSLVDRFVQTEQFAELLQDKDPKAQTGKGDVTQKQTAPKERNKKSKDITEVTKQSDWKSMDSWRKPEKKKVSSTRIRGEDVNLKRRPVAPASDLLTIAW